MRLPPQVQGVAVVVLTAQFLNGRVQCLKCSPRLCRSTASAGRVRPSATAYDPVSPRHPPGRMRSARLSPSAPRRTAGPGRRSGPCGRSRCCSGTTGCSAWRPWPRSARDHPRWSRYSCSRRPKLTRPVSPMPLYPCIPNRRDTRESSILDTGLGQAFSHEHRDGENLHQCDGERRPPLAGAQRASRTEPCDGVQPETGRPCVLGHHGGYHRDASGAEWLDD